LAERARPYLEPGEQIQAVFRAQSGLSPYWVPLTCVAFAVVVICAPTVLPTVVGAFWIVYALGIVFLIVFFRIHHVVVTDRAIVVLDTLMPFLLLANRPTRLRLRHPRNFYFGRMSGLWGKFVLDNTKYRVHWWFHKDVAVADAALTEMMWHRQPGPAAAAPVREQPGSLPAAGWYPDPAGGSAMRYWDGSRWGPPAQQARPY
jgi:hypothetical protein